MKRFQVLLGLSLVVLSTRADAFEQSDYRYRCEALGSDKMSFVTVDSNGKYFIYEDSSNNCNGRRNLVTRSSLPLFETDCEWNEGFVNFILESGMIEGENRGQMIAKADQVEKPIKCYLCSRI